MVLNCANLNRWCELAGIPFGYTDEFGYHHNWMLYSPKFKRQKQTLEFILSFLKLDTDADLLAHNYRTWEGYRSVFFKQDNWLFKLDQIAQKQVLGKSSLNIVITGLGSLTGCGKSWSAIALCMRWSPRDKKGRIIYSPEKNILMEESELDRLEPFKQSFYSLDDPELNTVGIGINTLKDRLSKFMRIASRFGQTSLLICSAIDILKSERLSLDGVHYFIEMVGVNSEIEQALGLLYDRFYTPKGWVIIPSPTKTEIDFYDISKSKHIKRKMVFYEPETKKTWKPKEIMQYYESELKTTYVGKTMADYYDSPLKKKIEKILSMPKFKEWILQSHNQKQTQIEAWIITESGIKVSQKEYGLIARRVFSKIKELDHVVVSSKKDPAVIREYFTFTKELAAPLEDLYFEAMFSEEAKQSLKAISRSIPFRTLIEQTWQILRLIYVDRMSTRDIEKEEGLSRGWISDHHKKAREMFIGYLDEFAYHKLNPKFLWQGGNDNLGLADFLDQEKEIVISKKFRYSRDWTPGMKDLSQQEKDLIEKGWKGQLVLTDGISRKLKIYSITPPPVKTSSQPLSLSPSSELRQRRSGPGEPPKIPAATKPVQQPAKRTPTSRKKGGVGKGKKQPKELIVEND